MSDIFISYAHEDFVKAGVLASIFTGQGWSVFWDRHIRVGTVFDEVIEREVDSAKCVVALWSASSVASQWVRAEADEGAQRNALVSVLIEDVRLPLGIRRIKAANLVDWKGDPHDQRVKDLLAALAAFVGGEQGARATPTPRRPPAPPEPRTARRS